MMSCLSSRWFRRKPLRSRQRLPQTRLSVLLLESSAVPQNLESERGTASAVPQFDQSLSFFISFLLCPLPSSMPRARGRDKEPGARPAEPLLPPPAEEPPVPSVDAELEPEPEPAAEPPVPT